MTRLQVRDRYGIFDDRAAANALKILEKALDEHGTPASIMTDRGSGLYDDGDGDSRGPGAFGAGLAELGIRHLLTGTGGPKTGGKLKRTYGEVHRKLHRFEEIMMR